MELIAVFLIFLDFYRVSLFYDQGLW